MATINAINNTILNANFTVPAGSITASGNISSTAGAMSAFTTVTAGNGLIATAGGVTATGNSTINSSGAGTNAIGTGTNSGTINIGNTNSGAVNIDCGTAGINVGATANAHASVFGSTNSTSATTVQSGSGALAVTSANGTLTINSGTGALSISSDASATTVNVATGGAAKVATLGSTNGASQLALRYGTADFTLASATGTVMSALDTGEITYPLQPAFLGELQTTVTNVTGAAASFILGTTTALIEIFDQNGDFNPTGGVFTAPVTAKYHFDGMAWVIGTTVAAVFTGIVVTSNRNYFFSWTRDASNTSASVFCSTFGDMDAADTAHFAVQVSGEAGNTDDVNGAAGGGGSTFAGYLVC